MEGKVLHWVSLRRPWSSLCHHPGNRETRYGTDQPLMSATGRRSCRKGGQATLLARAPWLVPSVAWAQPQPPDHEGKRGSRSLSWGCCRRQDQSVKAEVSLLKLTLP